MCFHPVRTEKQRLCLGLGEHIKTLLFLPWVYLLKYWVSLCSLEWSIKVFVVSLRHPLECADLVYCEVRRPHLCILFFTLFSLGCSWKAVFSQQALTRWQKTISYDSHVLYWSMNHILECHGKLCPLVATNFPQCLNWPFLLLANN